ncbi:hypothetical protein BJY04DRAFT_183103 [Aspergillus karnatakaensis]|uniref:uncharacterized protein n=1 Tax=Aspergillus karnatakaensis TaxID=1810916 RepID=UPI003CCD2EA5
MPREDAVWKLSSMLTRGRAYLNSPRTPPSRRPPHSHSLSQPTTSDQTALPAEISPAVPNGGSAIAVDSASNKERLNKMIHKKSAGAKEAAAAPPLHLHFLEKHAQPVEPSPEVSDLIGRLENLLNGSHKVPAPSPKFNVGIKEVEDERKEEGKGRTGKREKSTQTEVEQLLSQPRPFRVHTIRDQDVAKGLVSTAAAEAPVRRFEEQPQPTEKETQLGQQGKADSSSLEPQVLGTLTSPFGSDAPKHEIGSQDHVSPSSVDYEADRKSPKKISKCTRLVREVRSLEDRVRKLEHLVMDSKIHAKFLAFKSEAGHGSHPDRSLKDPDSPANVITGRDTELAVYKADVESSGESATDAQHIKPHLQDQTESLPPPSQDVVDGQEATFSKGPTIYKIFQDWIPTYSDKPQTLLYKMRILATFVKRSRSVAERVPRCHTQLQLEEAANYALFGAGKQNRVYQEWLNERKGLLAPEMAHYKLDWDWETGVAPVRPGTGPQAMQRLHDYAAVLDIIFEGSRCSKATPEHVVWVVKHKPHFKRLMYALADRNERALRVQALYKEFHSQPLILDHILTTSNMIVDREVHKLGEICDLGRVLSLREIWGISDLLSEHKKSLEGRA